MAFVNYNNKEITAKIVYYGPALSGKTTCLRYVYNDNQIQNKGRLITLDTDGDRTLFFDFLPLEIGKLGNYAIKIQLYTVPGQVAYDTTRKLVLQGADGVVFVCDSQVVMRDQNIDSFNNLKKNLKLNNLQISDVPLIFHYNKRDLREIMPIESLNRDLNPDNRPFFPTIAPSGENVLEGLHTIIKLVMIHLKNKLSIFQKDKTVMFTRDEITTSAKPADELRVEPPSYSDSAFEVGKADTEEEEIFELSAPLTEAAAAPTPPPPTPPARSPKPPAAMPLTESDEIFDLGDEFLGKEEAAAGFDVPEITFEDEEKKTDLFREEEVARIDIESDTRDLVRDVPIIDVPVEVELPPGLDEVSIRLHLRLRVKKS